MDSKSEWRQKNYRISNQPAKTVVQVQKIQREESYKPQIPMQQQGQKIVNSEVDKLKRENDQLKSELFAAKEQIKILLEENKKLQQEKKNQSWQTQRSPHEMMMAMEMQRSLRHQQYYEFMQEAMMPQQQLQFQTDGMTYEQILELQEQVGHVSKGLPKEKLQELPQKYSKKQKDLCTICYNDIERNDKIIELKCNHSYHPKCITKWLQNEKKCPVCLQEVIEI